MIRKWQRAVLLLLPGLILMWSTSTAATATTPPPRADGVTGGVPSDHFAGPPAASPPASAAPETTSLGGENDPGTAAVEYTQKTCIPKGPNTKENIGKTANACDPTTESVFDKHVKWTKTTINTAGHPIGRIEQAITRRAAPGGVSAAASAAPQQKVIDDVPPPTSNNQSGEVTTQAVGGIDDSRDGGCCSDAGIDMFTWNVTYSTGFPQTDYYTYQMVSAAGGAAAFLGSRGALSFLGPHGRSSPGCRISSRTLPTVGMRLDTHITAATTPTTPGKGVDRTQGFCLR